jgi:hypothetical protein
MTRPGIIEAITCALRARCGEELYARIGDDDLFRPHGLATLASDLPLTP